MEIGGAAFVLVIVLAALATGVIKQYMRQQSHQQQTAGIQGGAEARVRLADLERRVQTLEQIVTDQGYDLKREFEKL